MIIEWITPALVVAVGVSLWRLIHAEIRDLRGRAADRDPQLQQPPRPTLGRACVAALLICASAASAQYPTLDYAKLSGIGNRISKAAPPTGNPRGFIQNAEGGRCQYVQVATGETQRSHFFPEALVGSDTVLAFDDPSCMAAADSVFLEINQRQINRVLARWYSLPDADFEVEPAKMAKRCEFQTQGGCLQSRKYPTKSILVEYFRKGEGISTVVHTEGIGGCARRE